MLISVFSVVIVTLLIVYLVYTACDGKAAWFYISCEKRNVFIQNTSYMDFRVICIVFLLVSAFTDALYSVQFSIWCVYCV